MIPLQPRSLLILIFILIIIGFVLPWLMVLHIIDSTFFLNFVAYTALVAGMFLSAVGIATYVSGKGNRRR